MLRETVIWIFIVAFISYKHDIYLLNSINKMSDIHYLITFSFSTMFFFYTFYKFFFLYRKKELNESFIWITFIITMSISCRNRLGEDLDSFHFLFFSLTILYLIYIFRSIYPKEEILVFEKIIIINLIVLKILWPGIIYLWPYGTDYSSDFDWTGWPDINF